MRCRRCPRRGPEGKVRSRSQGHEGCDACRHQGAVGGAETGTGQRRRTGSHAPAPPEAQAPARSGQVHLRRHGRDPHAEACRRICRSRPTRSPTRPSARKAGAAIVHLHARDPKDGSPSSARGVPPFLKIKQRCDVRHQPHHRRRADHERSRSACSPAPTQARGRLAQHGLDELRPVRDARALQGIQVRLGEALSRRLATTASSRTPSRTSPTS